MPNIINLLTLITVIFAIQFTFACANTLATERNTRTYSKCQAKRIRSVYLSVALLACRYSYWLPFDYLFVCLSVCLWAYQPAICMHPTVWSAWHARSLIRLWLRSERVGLTAVKYTVCPIKYATLFAQFHWLPLSF